MEPEASPAKSRGSERTASLLRASRIIEFARAHALILDPPVFAAIHAYLCDPRSEAAAAVAALAEAGSVSEKSLHEVASRFAPSDARPRTETVQRGVAPVLATIAERMEAHASSLDEDERLIGRIEQSLAAIPSPVPGKQAGALADTFKSIVSLYRRRRAALRLAIDEYSASLRTEQVRIAEISRENEVLRTETTLDGLTGLLNRRGLDARLSRMDGAPYTVLMLDIDHFKAVNDRFGHPAGDSVIKSVAEIIRRSLRAGDVAARMGGEEFAVILPATGEEVAEILATRIREGIAAYKFVAPQTGEPIGIVTVSIGGACSLPSEKGDALVERADQALYASKRGGRDRFTLCRTKQWAMAS